jgi:hypothetical protein
MTKAKVSYNKLARLGLLWALIILSHLGISLGMPAGNASKRCLVCDHLDRQRSGPGIPLHQRTLLPRPRQDRLACSTLRRQEPCQQQIPVQLYHCELCRKYAWVPTGDCPSHPRAQPLYWDSDDIESIRRGGTGSDPDTSLRL